MSIFLKLPPGRSTLSDALQSINYNAYSSLLEHAATDVEHFALIDHMGVCQWDSGRCSGEELYLMCDSKEIYEESYNIYYSPVAGHKTRCRIQLKSFAGFVVADIIFIVKNGSENIFPVLASIAGCIENEFAVLTEMEDMARELSDRYNELNLVYEADDHVFNNIEGKIVLEKLVTQCTEYMDVFCTMLYLPEKNIIIQSKNRHAVGVDMSEVFYQIKNDLYKHLKNTIGPLVLNTEKDYLAAGLVNYGKVKLLSCPILTREDKVIGVLVSIRTFEMGSDFTNSDRNLLEAMANRVTRVLHSSIDDLTGLINRAGFEACLQSALYKTSNSNIVSSLLSIDIDQMQIINDVGGQEAGDTLIKNVGHILEQEVRESDKLARLNGDVFVIMLVNINLSEAVVFAEKVRSKISEYRYIWATTQFDISVSIGVVEFNKDSSNTDTVISCAEIACKTAKEAGRNCVRVYHNQDLEVVRRKGQIYWANHVRQALREDRFVLYSQHIASLTDKEDFHCEILMRMLDESGKILVPAQFMPAAEQYILMPLIDRWVVKNTISSISMVAHALENKTGHIAINISGQSIGQDGFTEFLIGAVSESVVAPAKLCFEITETAAIKNLQYAKDMILSLKKLGCRFSLDDFGTGLSSFTYLKQLPVDFLKIDGSFVKEILHDDISKAMVAAIISVGKAMKIKTIAEFVENDEIKSLLKTMGVDYAQGYGIGKPGPLKEQLDTLVYEDSDNEISRKTNN